MSSPPVTLAPYNEIARGLAERLAAGRDPGDPLAPWREEVIVASSGVSQAIASELLKRLPEGIAGLQMHSIETLARRIVNAAGEFPRVATEQERRLAMRTATRSLDDPLVTTRGAAAMLERSYRDVRDSGITLAEFARRAAAKNLRNRERIRLVIRAWQMYERLIARIGAVDPADLLARASALASSVLGPRSSVYLLAGFYDMTGAQSAVVRALQAVERIAHVYTPQPAPGRATETVLVAKTREDEIRSTCAEVAALVGSGASIGIVARSLDPYDVQLFERFSRELGFAVSETVPHSLAAHRFGRAAISLVRLREQNFPRGEVLEIVRSGLKLGTRINADKADADTRYETVAGGRSADLRQRQFKSLAINDYIEAVAELEALTDRIDAGWLRRIAGSFRIDTGDDRNAVAALQEIAALFTRAEAWNRPLDTAALIDAIESAEQPRTADRGPRTVWLGDVMRLRGRSFDHLFAVRMQDDVIPQRRTEDPLLVDEDRDRLGIRRIGDGRDEEHLLFAILRDAAAKSLTMSYAASDGFGKPLRKSHYLRAFGVAPRALARRPAAEAAAAARHRPLQLLVRSGTQSVFDGYIRSQLLREKVEQVLQSVSPTHLEDFGECPQKFLWKHLLKVRALEDPEMDMQLPSRDKGKVDHKILERFYSEAHGDPSALDRLVDEEFDKLEETLPPFNPPIRRIEREATKRLLHDFAIEDVADLEEHELLPAHFEYKFDPVTIDIEGTALHVGGTIDRVDEGGDRYRIVDYKSGKAMRHNKLADKIDRGVRLQLALYALAAVDLFHTTSSHVSGVIKPIGGAAKLEKFSFDLAQHETALRETLALFVAAMRRGDFPAFPHEDDDFNSCLYCPVNHSCRTKHDAGEHRIVMRYADPRALLEDRSA